MYDYNKYTSFVENSSVTAIKKDEKWVVVCTFQQGRLPKDDVWESKTVEFKSTDTDPRKAAGDVVATLYSFLQLCKGDLFKEGEEKANVEIAGNEASE